ncbi:MAG TPA: hypothetical protein VG963_06860, partial [Polyangiaceae bacterium]|nr:hypothetical protein [Polyangiaceae bacterium]
MDLQRTPISIEEKRAALSRLLLSRALGRSEQLRAFLRYVCEAEIEGRAGELNEYVLGVSVLGRPTDYSPGEDSCVRSRAYELRAKLRAYYDAEAPDDPVRIEIDKGGYAPRFSRPESAAREQASEPSPASGLSAELRALWDPFMESKAPLLIAFDLRLFFHA